MKEVSVLICAAALAWGQASQPAGPPPPFTKQYLPVQQFSQEEDLRLIKLFEGLRVTDVADGLDVAGLQDITLMDQEIGPLWRDNDNFSHRIYGVALTVRTVPAQERAPNFASHAEFSKWERNWYKTRGGEFARLIRPGTILVIDSGPRDDGICGSANSLGWVMRGLRGVVSNAACRDVDELVLTKLPVYQARSPRGIDPGRMWVESYNQPVTVGHVLVMPGDIIVADMNGVAVVPRAKAEQVAAAARKIHDSDEAGRRKMLEKLGRPLDFTVKDH